MAETLGGHHSCHYRLDSRDVRSSKIFSLKGITSFFFDYSNDSLFAKKVEVDTLYHNYIAIDSATNIDSMVVYQEGKLRYTRTQNIGEIGFDSIKTELLGIENPNVGGYTYYDSTDFAYFGAGGTTSPVDTFTVTQRLNIEDSIQTKKNGNIVWDFLNGDITFTEDGHIGMGIDPAAYYLQMSNTGSAPIFMRMSHSNGNTSITSNPMLEFRNISNTINQRSGGIWWYEQNSVSNMMYVQHTDVSNSLGDFTFVARLTAGGFDDIFRIQNDGIVANRVDNSITASTTQTQGQQPLTTAVNEVAVVANANDVVTLDDAIEGAVMEVINNGANVLQIYPASGDDLGSGVDASTTLASGSNAIFRAYDATNWELLNVAGSGDTTFFTKTNDSIINKHEALKSTILKFDTAFIGSSNPDTLTKGGSLYVNGVKLLTYIDTTGELATQNYVDNNVDTSFFNYSQNKITGKNDTVEINDLSATNNAYFDNKNIQIYSDGSFQYISLNDATKVSWYGFSQTGGRLQQNTGKDVSMYADNSTVVFNYDFSENDIALPSISLFNNGQSVGYLDNYIEFYSSQMIIKSDDVTTIQTNKDSTRISANSVETIKVRDDTTYINNTLKMNGNIDFSNFSIENLNSLDAFTCLGTITMSGGNINLLSGSIQNAASITNSNILINLATDFISFRFGGITQFGMSESLFRAVGATDGAGIVDEVSSATNPTLLPFSTVQTTGIGGLSADYLSAIVNSSEITRFDDDTTYINNTLKLNETIIAQNLTESQEEHQVYYNPSTGEITQREVIHGHGYFEDSSITLNLTTDTWVQVTNTSDSLFRITEDEGMYWVDDTLILTKTGHYDFNFDVSFIGDAGERFEARLYNVTQAEEIPRKGIDNGEGAGDPITIGAAPYCENCNNGDKIIMQIRNAGAADPNTEVIGGSWKPTLKHAE